MRERITCKAMRACNAGKRAGANRYGPDSVPALVRTYRQPYGGIRGGAGNAIACVEWRLGPVGGLTQSKAILLEYAQEPAFGFGQKPA